MNQYVQQIDAVELEKIEKFIEPEVLEVVRLPSQVGVIDVGEISVEISFTETQLRDKQGRQVRNAVLFGASFIFDIKEKEVKLAIIRLYGLVYKRFVEEAKRLGKDLKSGNVKQIVEVPVSYLDLDPSSTSIHFKVFTKRKLVAVEAE